jgi:hypothetical protein
MQSMSDAEKNVGPGTTVVAPKKRKKVSRRHRIKAVAGKKLNKVLVGIRVLPNFHRRIQTECVRRDMSLQELVVAALKVYFASPVEWDHANVTFYSDDPNFTKKQADERNAWSDLWERYLTRMPREKVQIMTTAMEWDLQMLKSSRRKPVGGDLAPSTSEPGHE